MLSCCDVKISTIWSECIDPCLLCDEREYHLLGLQVDSKEKLLYLQKTDCFVADRRSNSELEDIEVDVENTMKNNLLHCRFLHLLRFLCTTVEGEVLTNSLIEVEELSRAMGEFVVEAAQCSETVVVV